jgi:sugar phosphate isomerase/epimerase
LELLHEIPDLKLVFDTGNPVFQLDRSKPEPYPWQDSLAFYHDVKDAIEHVHVKDAKINSMGEVQYCFAGEGEGHVPEILTDLKKRNYDGFIAIEPHMGKVFHQDDMASISKNQYDIYLKYGQRFEYLLTKI